MQINGLSQIQILDKFIRGLKPKTRIIVELRDPQIIEEAYHLADQFDRIVYGIHNSIFLIQRPSYNQSNSAYAIVGTYDESMQIDTLRTRPRASNFNNPHKSFTMNNGSRNSPTMNNHQRLYEQPLYFNCQTPGHITSECRQ